jgi:uncharacterized protein YecT (DUF1311 family)
VALEGCAERAILQSDREINAEARAIFRLLRVRRSRITFNQGEEAWLEYRGSSCTAQASFYDRGSAQPVVYGSCIAARNRTHRDDLVALKATLSQH